MRTTLDIDAVVLKDLKRLQKEEAKSLGRLVSELLASALKTRGAATRRKPRFRLKTYDLGRPLVDLNDKQAVQAVLDDEDAR